MNEIADDFRTGTFAVYQGRTYPAPTPPNERRELTLPDPQVSDAGTDTDTTLTVRLDELDAWYTVSWTFSWFGEPFSVLDTAEGLIKGLYKGGQYHFAWEYLEQELAADGKREIYTVILGVEDVQNLTEHRTDLLTYWKEAREP